MSQKGFANILILIIAIVIVVIAGSGGYIVLNRLILFPKLVSTLPESPAPNPIENPKPTPTPNMPVQSQSPDKIPQAHNIFGIDVFKILAQEEGNRNIFISPPSIALTLSMVYNGANGETKNAIQKTLQFQNLNIITINQESLSLINSLKNPDTKVELSMANSIWARKNIYFKRNFLDLVSGYFNAEVSTLDFSNESAPRTINSWVSKNTKGKISVIVSPPIPDNMVMYLINAVYFKGSWTTEFDKKLTESRNFTAGDGSSRKHSLMRQHGNMAYFETNDFQSVNLPYGNNKRLGMYVFLPKNLNSFIQSLDIDKWNDWMKQYRETEGTILLPRFKIEYEKGLIPILTKLGMGIAFTNQADLTGIGNNLTISEVKHKTYVDVNEEGTEAAAITSVGVGTTSIQPEKKTFYMEANRPFFFAIRDNQTREVLFLGVLQNP